MNVPSKGLIKLKPGGFDTAMLSVVDLLAPAASKAVATKVWLPEPTVLALKLNWYRLLVPEQYLEQALGAVRVPMLKPSSFPSIEVIAKLELAETLIKTVPVVPLLLAFTTSMLLMTFTSFRTVTEVLELKLITAKMTCWPLVVPVVAHCNGLPAPVPVPI